MGRGVGSPDTGRSDVAAGLFLAAVALAWGAAAAPRCYGEGDSSELTLALALGGMPHPTGYPLYVLAGHLATSLLHGLGIAWPVAANAWSALGSAVAIFFLHRLAVALAGERLPASGMARSLLTTIPFLPLLAQPAWHAAASMAEVTSWHAAWTLGAAWTAWRLAREAPGSPLPRFFLGGAVIGLGLAHRATSVLVAIPLAVWAAPRLRRSAGGGLALPASAAFAAFALGLLLPLLSWGWITYRALHPAAFQWPLLEPGWAGLVGHVTARAYGGYLGGFNPSAPEMRLLATAIPWIAVGLVAWLVEMLASGPGPRRTFAFAVGTALLAQALFVFAYRVPDPSAHVVPILALVALYVPAFGARILARAGGAAASLAGAALLIALLPAWIGADLRAKRSAKETDRIVREAWRRVPFEHGLVFWNNDLYARLRAYQILERDRPALIVEHPGVLTWAGPRRRFQETHGFDPWNGATPRSDADLVLLPELAERAGGLPAVDFDDLIRAAGGAGERAAP